jgi:hypothetical protein
MAGLFELFVDAQSHVRFRLTAPDGQPALAYRDSALHRAATKTGWPGAA